MQRDGAVKVAPTWAHDDDSHAEECHGGSYREIDRQLRRIAAQRAGLDVEEAAWLREAERQRIWRKLGYATALEYLEDVFGYAPRTALERLRVAKELGELPELEDELRSGAMSWSAAKELTRVMTPLTQGAWLARARGKNVHEIERMVAGHKKGDDPDAPKDPELVTRRIVIELVPRVDALFQRARLMFEHERGEHLDDAALIEALCMRALEPARTAHTTESRDARSSVSMDMASAALPDASSARSLWSDAPNDDSGAPSNDDSDTPSNDDSDTPPNEDSHAPSNDDSGAPSNDDSDSPTTADSTVRAAATKAPSPFDRIITFKCEDCSRAWREGRGRLVAITASDLAAAACDAELVHGLRPAEVSDDHPTRSKRRTPATLSIPRATRDFVWTRDQGRCRVPGCRATRNLACHHIEFRSRGGDHDAANLILICDGHHKLLHDGLLAITGRAPDQLAFERDGKRLIDGRAHADTEARSTSDIEGRSASDIGDRSAADIEGRGFVHAIGKHARNEVGKRSRFADVVKLEHAKQALVQLGYKARAARSAVEAACAHVGVDVDVAMIVKTALQLDREAAAARVDGSSQHRDHVAQLRADAKQALRQLGYASSIAESAVEAACAHVGAEADLTTLIKEALRRCGGT